MDYRQKIENYLKDNGIQKKWFAEKIGMSPAALFMILSGKRKMPQKYWEKIIELTKGKVKKMDFMEDFLGPFKDS